MKQTKATLFLLLFGLCVISFAQTDEATTEPAKLFRAGQFAAAEKACDQMLRKARNDFAATLLKGRLALLGNRLDEAQRWLTKARQLKAEDKQVINLLAEVAYRRDDFQQAATLLRTAGKNTMAAQMESFKGQVPYLITAPAQTTRVPFIHTDPLPLIAVKINGSAEANFIIDTGGAEVILDTDFARQHQAQIFGQEERTFGGGRRAPMEFGRIDSLSLGELEIKNVPVHILSTKAFSAAAQGKPVSGIIGTVLLYHFLTTLDYSGGALVLQPRNAATLKRFTQQATAEKQSVVPFWLAGDHFIVASGRVGNSKPVMLFVDTGLAGNSFTGPRSILDEGGINVPEGQTFEGVGGGGRMKIVPVTIDEIALGPITRRKLGGLSGPFPETLEYSQGFRIGGIISHQFFRPYAISFDFTGMRLFLKDQTPAVR